MSLKKDGAQRLLLGIDLGTSLTAVISNRGKKALVRSVVGYPHDIIATKILNDVLVVGDEALVKRSYLDIYFPLADGVLKEGSHRHSQAAKELLEYSIAQINPQPGDEIFGIIGVPARASVSNKNHLLKLASSMMTMAMVVSEPFMAAYGLNRLTNAIIIDIGAGTVDFCAMKGTVPTSDDQITLIKAGNYIDDMLVAAIEESYPQVQITPLLAKKIKEQYGYVGEQSEEIVVTLRSNGKPSSYDVGPEVGRACSAILPDIFETLESLVPLFDPEHQEEALQNIILAGGGGHIRGLSEAIVDHMQDYGDVNVVRVADPAFSGAAGALKLATELPLEYWHEVGDVVGEIA
ncbi:MAG: rod shape-determining protein [Magnetococcales bacterium]|nr:rod shape-determining protein [Magnetococcales bacterium]